MPKPAMTIEELIDLADESYGEPEELIGRVFNVKENDESAGIVNEHLWDSRRATALKVELPAGDYIVTEYRSGRCRFATLLESGAPSSKHIYSTKLL